MKTTASGTRVDLSFRAFLQRELARRCADNPQYSLRAFAKSLKIDHSTLSQVLRGIRRLTAQTIESLAAELGLSDDDIKSYVSYEQVIGCTDAMERHECQLYEEAIEVITQWQHFAILELTRLESFQPDSRIIARVLDISVDDVNRAITRLVHLGLLQMVDSSTWIDLSRNAYANLDRWPGSVARQVMGQRSRIGKMADQNHVMTSSTMAVDSRRLLMVANYLEKVRHEIAVLLDSGGDSCDDVYQLDISLAPLTKLHQENKNG